MDDGNTGIRYISLFTSLDFKNFSKLCIDRQLERYNLRAHLEEAACLIATACQPELEYELAGRKCCICMLVMLHEVRDWK